MGTNSKFTRPWFASSMAAGDSAPTAVRTGRGRRSRWLGSASAASCSVRKSAPGHCLDLNRIQISKTDKFLTTYVYYLTYFLICSLVKMAPAEPKKLFDPELNMNKPEFDQNIFL